MDSNDDKHFGFMEALVGRARKTLFINPENTSDAANGKQARSGKPRSSRGRSSATSSLAKIDSNQGKGKENKAPAAIGEISKCATEEPGKCADKRRSLKQTGTCSLSACNSSESSGHDIAKIKSGRPRGKRDARKVGNDLEGACDRSRACRGAGEKCGQKKGRKRGGRGKHQTSSLIVQQNEAHIEQDTKHAPKVSSLMALPASTQKTQKSNFPARGGRNKTASSSTLPKGDPGDSVSDLLNKLSIEGKSSVCFTPSTTRVRTSLMAGTITSPPAAQRCSTLSDNGGFFSERSPMPDLNPKKRFDSKKTPDCKFLQAGGSPMDTSLSPMSPSPREGKSSPVEPTQTSDHAKRRARLFCDEVETHVDEANVRKPGSAVLEVEAPTPRFPKRSEAVLPKVHLETGGIAHLEKPVVESVKAVPIDAEILCKATKQAPIEDNGNAAQLAVRRSTRESKQTDRLTVSSWRGKKKATSDGQDSPRSDEGVACAVESSFEQPVFKDAPSEELNQANSSENSNDGAGMRRSARESKQTDRLTVTWKKCNVTSRSDRSKSAGDGVENDNVENDDGKTPEVPKEKTAKLEVKGLPSPKREPDVPSPPTSDDSADAWSADEMRRLRTAQKEVDPTSILYWHEVARIVGNTKSPSECQRKWQCTIATPKPRRRELPDQSVAHSENDDAADGDDEDDLFNSTPMRIVCEEDRFTNFNIGEGGCQFSPLKQDALSDVQKPLRKGYNKYISNLKRDIKKKGTRPTGPKTNATASKVWAEPRRWELSCSFSVGEDEDSCDDDIWDDFNEETE